MVRERFGVGLHDQEYESRVLLRREAQVELWLLRSDGPRSPGQSRVSGANDRRALRMPIGGTVESRLSS